jgi:hypothetical protein
MPKRTLPGPSRKGSPENQAPAAAFPRRRRIPPVVAALALSLAMLLAGLTGYWLGKRRTESFPAQGSRAASIFSKPGPWGELEYLAITLTPPAELLGEREFSHENPHWKIPGMTRDGFAHLLAGAGEPEAARAGWLSASALREVAGGIELSPSCAMVRAMGDTARKVLYAALAGHPENHAYRSQILARLVATFPEYGIPDETSRSLVAYSVRHGRFLVNYSMPCVVPENASAADKHNLLKGLTQQPSRIVRLHISPRANLAGRAAYWGRGGQARKVRPLFESLYNLPAGGSVDLSELLPPMPAALLHTYESVSEYSKPADLPKNCSWTAMNFFSEHPDPGFTDLRTTIEALKRDYVPVTEPRLGDVAVFFTPGMDVVHVASYLADDLYFTKNGSSALFPWVVNSGPILLQMYSFGLPAGDSLTIRHFRPKGE